MELQEMKEQILEMMQNAADNGQPLWDWEPEQVTWDIQTYVDEFADLDESQMIKVIKEIQKERNIA